MNDWSSIDKHISASLGLNFSSHGQTAISGGCINQTWCLYNKYSQFFVKLNKAEQIEMFVAESAALKELSASNTILSPKPICYGNHGHFAYLVLEYMPLKGAINSRLLGQQLAKLHSKTNRQFGWWRDNSIGTTPQDNTPNESWPDFWRDLRLAPQLQLAANQGYGKLLLGPGEKLLDKLSAFFTSYQPKASLLHGDLWSGNAAALADGTPVIYDPASYYGDRETDLALTELFGGFTTDFYAAYNNAWPLDAGYRQRKPLYNLYHILNHLNLFGPSYLPQAINTIEQLLAELG